MNYTELTQNIEDTCEQTFTADQLAMFVQQAEEKIYQAVDLPMLRKNQTGAATTDVPYLQMPTDLQYVHSMAVIDDNVYSFLMPKDVNFMREAYPNPTVTGTPKYYAIFDQNDFILAPTPDADYEVELHYGYRPESIVTTGTTWLGDEFDTVLLNGALVEAARFMKEEVDVIALYEKMFSDAMALLRDLGGWQNAA